VTCIVDNGIYALIEIPEAARPRATIGIGSDPMDGHARLRFSGSLHGFVDVMAPHALATILRQEGWVDIDDAMGVGVGLITDNESAMYALGVGKVSDQVLAVRPAA